MADKKRKTDDEGGRSGRCFSSTSPMKKYTEQLLVCREGSCALKPKARRGRVLFVDRNDAWGRQRGTSFNTIKFHAQREQGLKIARDANEGLAHTVCTTR